MKMSPYRGGRPTLRTLVLALALVAVAATVAACGSGNGSNSSSGSSGGSNQPGKGVRLGLVLPDVSNPFINAIAIGAKQEAAKQGAEILIKGSNESAQQVSAMQNYVSAHVDAIGFDSIDAKAIGSSVQDANSANIPVFSVVSTTNQGKVDAFISADFHAAGKLVGEEVGKHVCANKNPCRVAVVQGALADQAGLDGDHGFRQGLSQSPNAEIVADQATNYDATEALKATQDMLTAHPDLDFIHAWWSAGTLAVVEGIKGAHRQVGASSLTGACPVLQDVLKNEVQADAMMFPEIMGREFVKQAIAKVKKGTTPPPTTNTPVYLITPQKAKALLSGATKPPADLPEVLVHLKQAQSNRCPK